MYRVETNSEVETWKNASASRVVIKKFSYDGKLKDEIVRGHGVVTVSAQERKINAEMAADASQDVFSNGALLPVQLVETADDLEQIQENPNLLSETDMGELLDGHHKTLESRLGEISSKATVSRLLEIAQERDITTGKLKAIESRLAELDPEIGMNASGEDGTSFKAKSI